MIDRSHKEYWIGDQATDIAEYLRLYSGLDMLELHAVHCTGCGSDTFMLEVDENAGVIQTQCNRCGKRKILLNGTDLLADAEPVSKSCPICGQSQFQLQIGFDRQSDRSIHWIFSGSRCTSCGALMSFADWETTNGLTIDSERNL